VYRRERLVPSYGAAITGQPLQVTAHRDAAVAIGQDVCYVVATAISMDPLIESPASNEACVSVRDIVAPAAPVGGAALALDDGVEVSWSASGEGDLAGYRVYRSVDGAPPERVGEVPADQTTFLDARAPRGVRLAFHVTAVDRAGNESPPSEPTELRRP
jgi:hypothetical protein